MFRERLEKVRGFAPRIHNITNYVTANDCANMLLACGGSPIMADDPAEVEEVTAICSGLNINLGTLSQRTIPSMFSAGKKSNELGHPVVLDPVGAGVSELRKETVMKLLDEVQFSVIRGNVSEIKTLAQGSVSTHGVDADETDLVTSMTLGQMVDFAKDFSKKTGAVIVVTGAIDIVADSQNAYCIYNGHPDMAKVTGTGCQLSAMIAAYIAANPENILEAAAAAVCAMGICGEKAKERMTDLDGNVSYRNYIIDAIDHLRGDELERGARYEMR